PHPGRTRRRWRPAPGWRPRDWRAGRGHARRPRRHGRCPHGRAWRRKPGTQPPGRKRSRRSTDWSSLSCWYPRSGLALLLMDWRWRQQGGAVEPGNAQHEAARRVADEAVAGHRLEGDVVALGEHRVLHLDEHAQRLRQGQRCVVRLQDLPGGVRERQGLALAALRRVEELAVVVGGLAQPRQYPHRRGAHGTDGAVVVAGNAHRLAGALAGAAVVADGVVALPELQQLGLEFRRHLPPHWNRIEAHGCVPPCLRAAAARVRTEAMYSSNCRRLSPLASNTARAGASLPACMTRARLAYSAPSRPLSSLRSSFSNCVRSRAAMPRSTTARQ